MLVKKVYLFANVAIYAGVAAAFLAAPKPLGEAIGLRFESTAALADFRAMYGGLCLGAAISIAKGMRDAAWERSAILLAITSAAGLFLGRVLTLATVGPANPFTYASMASEVLAVAAGLFVYGRATEVLAEDGRSSGAEVHA